MRDDEYHAWLTQATQSEIERLFRDAGVEIVTIKRLAPNNNSKNQFYWQQSLLEGSLALGDFAEVASTTKRQLKGPGYKASLNLQWLTPEGPAPAPKAQLIAYPQYPETRLGSLIDGAEVAPRRLISGAEATTPDRLMLLGGNGTQTFGICLPAVCAAAPLLQRHFARPSDAFATWRIAPQSQLVSAAELLRELAAVHRMGPILGCKVRGESIIKSTDMNAPGTTFETVLGVRPNARDEPDFHGWELKAHGSARVTLMTPAPTGGSIVTDPADVFMSKFGWLNENGTRWDFNGGHRVGTPPGGKATTYMVSDSNLVQLVHKVTDEVAMSWRFADLLTHWAKKHALAAYVRRTGKAVDGIQYGPFVQLAEGVEWAYFTESIQNGTVLLDPAYNLLVGRSTMQKARAQIRCSALEISALYPSVRSFDLRHVSPSRAVAERDLRLAGLTLPTWLSRA